MKTNATTDNFNRHKPVIKREDPAEPVDISKEEPEAEPLSSPQVPTMEKRNNNNKQNKHYKSYSNIYQKEK